MSKDFEAAKKMRLADPFLVRNHVGPGILKVSMGGNDVFMVETTASARIRSKSEPEEAKLTAITPFVDSRARSSAKNSSVVR